MNFHHPISQREKTRLSINSVGYDTGWRKKGLDLSNESYDSRFHKIDNTVGEHFGMHNEPRHDFASMLVQGGTDIYIVQTLLGHKDGRMTKTYVHLSQENLRVAIRVLDKKKADKENLGHNLGTVSG